MDYDKKLAEWRERRVKALAWLEAGMARKDIAKRLKISRQRLSKIESDERERKSNGVSA